MPSFLRNVEYTSDPTKGSPNFRHRLFKPALKGPFGKEFTPVHITHRLSEESSLGLLVPVIALIIIHWIKRIVQNTILIRTDQNVKMGIAFFTHFTEICYDGIAYLNHQHSFSMLMG
jgi:hypothetical protein